jgi:hypothetical protein
MDVIYQFPSKRRKQGEEENMGDVIGSNKQMVTINLKDMLWFAGNGLYSTWEHFEWNLNRPKPRAYHFELLIEVTIPL